MMHAAPSARFDRGWIIVAVLFLCVGTLMGASIYGFIMVADIMARFAHVIESSKAGVRKPDPRIYEMMCEKLGVAPANCIYLDDLGINCKPASQLGMHAIKVTSGEQALADLSAALEMDLP